MSDQHEFPPLVGMTWFYGEVVCQLYLTRFSIKASRKIGICQPIREIGSFLSFAFSCIMLESDEAFQVVQLGAHFSF